VPEILATYDDFTGGHWGSVGPRGAKETQWGGVNILVTRQGNAAPCCASREFEFANATVGYVSGCHWAWGLDGLVYFIQQDGTAATWKLKAFDPDITAIPLSITQVGSITGPMAHEPDWVTLQNQLYVTVWGDQTYSYTPGTATLAALTGSYGAAAAGRAMCLYGDRLLVGGIKDARFGDAPNRIHFSGDDTNNDPTDRTAWESLNFFDVGADGTPIAGLYPTRDYLVVVLADQQVWTVTGVPGVNATSRRQYGFHKGKGGAGHFKASHAVVDPAQTRLWMFDHAYRGPARFNGATLSRIEQFGAPNASRAADNVVDGAVTPLGNPDEFLMHGVRVSRVAGEGVVANDLELIRYNSAYGLIQRSVIAER
jgi:hypothetical protein